jgi:hypothetical protein
MKKFLLLVFIMLFTFGISHAQIEIDGDMLDWAGVPAADAGEAAEELGDMHAADSMNYDIQDFYMTGNDSILFCRIVFDPAGSLVSGYNNGLAISMYFDTDAADTSGLDFGWWSLSLDYLIDLSGVAAGGTEATILKNINRNPIDPGWPDGWDSVGVAQMALNSTENEIEFSVNKHLIEANFNIRPVLDVVGYWDWGNPDQFPNANLGWDPAFMVDFNTVTNTSYVFQAKGPQIESEITIDGDMLDWTGFQIDVDETAEETGDMPTGADFDIQDVYMTSDSDYVYMRIVIDPAGTFTGQWNSEVYPNGDPVFELHFDTKVEINQGLSWYWWFIGGDYKIDLQHAYNPTDPQSDLTIWEYVGSDPEDEQWDSVATGAMVALNTSENELEIAIPRGLIRAGLTQTGGEIVRPYIYSVGDENWDNEEYFPNDLPNEGQMPAYVVNYQFVEGTGASNLIVAPEAQSIGDKGNSSVPNEFTVHQNYPNPFNPNTNISFSLPVAQKITLVVFDVLGRKVSTLVDNQRFIAGTNVVTWNGTNQEGDLVSSGVYFYQVSSDNFKVTRKMVLMR